MTWAQAFVSAVRVPPRVTGGGPNSDDGDAQLLGSFRAGNHAAFDALYRRNVDFVYGICIGILARPDDARDAVQEAFLRVFRKPDSFHGRSAFRTWLYRVTVNVCVEQLRKRSRRSEGSLEDEMVRELPDHSPSPSSGLERAEDEGLVRDLVASLPENHRVVLVLHYFQGLSYEEMREVLGLSLANVKVRLHRARRAFAREWENRGLGSAEMQGLR